MLNVGDTTKLNPVPWVVSHPKGALVDSVNADGTVTVVCFFNTGGTSGRPEFVIGCTVETDNSVTAPAGWKPSDLTQ